jgi:hypothetical protein
MADTNGANIAAAKLNAKQATTLLMLENAAANLQTTANQLGGFMKLDEPASVLLKAKELVDMYVAHCMKTWSGGIVIASPADVPNLDGNGKSPMKL